MESTSIKPSSPIAGKPGSKNDTNHQGKNILHFPDNPSLLYSSPDNTPSHPHTNSGESPE